MQTPSLFPAPAAVAHHAPPPAPPLSEQIQHIVAGGPQAWLPLLTTLGHMAVNLAIGVIILLITIWVAGWASKLAREAAGRFHRGDQPDTVLQGFIASLVKYAVVIIGGVAVLQQIGVQTTSVLAVLGAASLAIGLALQGGLSNVAAGVMILLLRPYRIGDRVEIAGVVGRVRGLDLFITRLHDLDNSVVFIPNAKALGEKIVNYSMPESRRIVMEFGIDYADDVDLALALLIETAQADERIVANPAPWAKLTELGDSTVTVTLRAWTSPDGYVDTRFDLIKAVKARFEAAGLTFAYPQQVAVETRPWTAPDRTRQRAELKRLRAAGKEAAACSEPTGDHSSGSASEAN
ncbi:mechanosensitive ion channel family protein [Phenylobacterium sp.]|uniref:mechanosensitive ion channel family protein n=1 Tax=Phenylobacterium sp. TaxID=1871053 RepID=UPI002DE6ABB8|nr:mechanosensitive ion channel family protein [Phenylobacterium sp.]